MTFVSYADFGVSSTLIDVLVAEGRPTPFPIQAKTLPDTMAGRDVLGRGKTGSGKTLAFSIPLVARLAEASTRRIPGRPRGLVLAPTRELATQITRVIEPLAKAVGLKVTTIFGGVSQRPQENALRGGIDIVVACPGRLEDLMGQGHIRLDAVEITVLDEADHMADMGFLPGVTRILAKTPERGQRMFFSATLDNGVDKLVGRFLHEPQRVSLDPAVSPVPAMTHHVYEVEGTDEKNALVFALASGTSRRILFTRTKHQAKKLAKQLTTKGIPAVDLHGNLSQNARDRNLAQFSSGEVKVLVATDVAARGVHVDNVDLVVHVDPPAEHKAYLHRSGRTARAGSAGDVVTVSLAAQRRDTQSLLRQAGIKVAIEKVTAASPIVTALIGEVAPRVAPVPGGPGSGNAVSTGGRPKASAGGRGGQGGASAGNSRRRNGRPQGGAKTGSSEGGRRSQGGQPRTERPVTYSTSSAHPQGSRPSAPTGGQRRHRRASSH